MKNVMLCAAMLCAAMLLPACSLTVRDVEKHEQTYTVGADVDAQGHITATQVDPDVPASIAAPLSAAVKQWQFTPATLNGRPVPAHTFIKARLQLLADPSGQNYLHISFTDNGPWLNPQGGGQPEYPMEAIRARRSAVVIVEATVQPDGSLTDMNLSNKVEGQPLPNYFKTAVLAAAKQWRAIPEQVDGQPVATRMRIPVTFSLEPVTFSPQSETFTSERVKIPRKATRKKTATENAEAARPSIPLPSEHEVALDSPLQPSAAAPIINAQ
jgi:TonB family protein